MRLIGWINSIHDNSGLFFVDLRDRKGITLVFDHKNPELSSIDMLFDELVIEVEGEVTLRPQETLNCKLKAGKVEVVVKKLIDHNICEILSFLLEDNKTDVVEEDLRYILIFGFPPQQKLPSSKDSASRTCAIRDYLNSNGFFEIISF